MRKMYYDSVVCLFVCGCVRNGDFICVSFLMFNSQSDIFLTFFIISDVSASSGFTKFVLLRAVRATTVFHMKSIVLFLTFKSTAAENPFMFILKLSLNINHLRRLHK